MIAPPRHLLSTLAVTALVVVLALVLTLAVAPSQRPGPGSRGSRGWRLEKVLPPQRPGDPPKRTPAPGRPRQNRRHRVLGAQPGAADHRRQPAHDPAGRVGLQRRGMARARHRMRRHRRAHRLGGTRRILDGLRRASGAGQRIRGKHQHVPPLEDNTLCHFADGQIVASYAHPAFQADSYQEMHAAGCIWKHPTAGSRANRWKNRSSARFSCTGTAARWKPNRIPKKGMRSRTCACSKGIMYESVRIAPGDRDSTHQARTARHPSHQLRRVCSPRSNRKPKCRCTRAKSAPKRSKRLAALERRRHAVGRRRAQAGRRRHARAGDGRAPRRRRSGAS